ncbi:GNAT family N-acetyltransferase [Alkalihalobacillus pseudalcaliphilus]|uniref:GNAT family N-acetyltransferase n=1 Tax=Alkalihalobacillus pseudalcaliphilus TaxID=79884 RepID=UPI00064DC611|nr:GNAT family N-acetyltransferase [Alkalihalobacillus pseudalcaliphilus]KMK76014.1 acetyltransferase [Alkalihalobacillus pseudalcaliphilus]
MKIIQTTTDKQLQDAYEVRTKVFVEEQKVAVEEEIDQFESSATHFVIYNESDKPVGAARLREVDGYGKIERVCLLQEVRGTGLGHQLMNQLLAHIQTTGLTKAKLNAQVQAIIFYEKLGFSIVSEQFLDAGIPHVTMIKHF